MKSLSLKILFYCLSLLPLWILYIISDFLYIVAYKIYGKRKKIVSQNLTSAFPDKNKKEIQNIQDNFYHHFFDLIVETIKSISANKQFIKKRVIFKNIELFNKYSNKNKSIVLAVSHYGNWEWGILGISLNAKQKMMGVYKKLNNSFFNDFMNKTRKRFGADLVEMKESFKYIINTNDECKIIGLLADQSPLKNESNYWTTFLNQETAVYLGPEKISKKMNYPVLFCSMKKIKRGKYEVLIEELCINPKETTKGQITSLYLHKIEEKIKQKPEFWLWTHRRWKHKK